MSQLQAYRKRILEFCPELKIESIRLNREGLLNDVIIVNAELVFRFVKPGFGFTDLLEEAKILHFLENYITLKIPVPFHESHEVLGYRLISGETLRRDQLILRAQHRKLSEYT